MGADDNQAGGGVQDLVFDGERFVPGAGVGIAYEHWSRYALAATIVDGKDVLEVACGEGYGTAHLARTARSVVAFDASPEALQHAQAKYGSCGARYVAATVREFFASSTPASFDVVVAFEVIEHLDRDEQAILLDGIRSVLRPGGQALISTPDKLLYTDRSLAVNPFHVHEYYREEFVAELSSRFACVRVLDQLLLTACAIVAPGSDSAGIVQVRWEDLRTAKASVEKGLRAGGEYLVAQVSQDELPELRGLLLADSSCKLIAERLRDEHREVDRLARALEEARRAWEGAMKDGGEARAALQAARAEAEGLQQRVEAAARTANELGEARAARLEAVAGGQRQQQLAEAAAAESLLLRSRLEAAERTAASLDESLRTAARLAAELEEERARVAASGAETRRLEEELGETRRRAGAMEARLGELEDARARLLSAEAASGQEVLRLQESLREQGRVLASADQERKREARELALIADARAERMAREAAEAESQRMAGALTAAVAAAEQERARRDAESEAWRRSESALREQISGLDLRREQVAAQMAAAQARIASQDLRLFAGQTELRRLALHRSTPLDELQSAVRASRPGAWKNPRSAVRELKGTIRERRLARFLESSGLFDRAYYLARHGDVTRSGMDPLLHYIRHGAAEGRATHPYFDTLYYLRGNPDVAATGVNPLEHFLRFGWKEGRECHPGFDSRYYVTANPDVAQSGVNPLLHWLAHGSSEGRRPLSSPPPPPTASPQLAAAPSNGAPPASADAAPAPRQPADPLAGWRSGLAAHPRQALVFDAAMLTPDRDSGSITTLEIIRALQSLGYAATFIPFDLRRQERYASALEEAGVSCITEREVGSINDFLSREGAVFDVVVLSRITVACHLIEPVRIHCPKATVAFETMDLHYLREQRQAQLTGSQEALRTAQATEKVELDLVRRADVTFVHSTVEMEVLRKRTPTATLYHLPYVLEAQGRTADFASRKDIVFLGGFRHSPNVDAVTFFAQEVFPLVRQQLPGVRFLIVGSDPGPEVLSLAAPDVVVVGYVEQLRPVFEACRLTVAPLRYGAGYKGKVAMSLAHGVPSVLTGIAAEGMQLVGEEHVLLADDAPGLAREVVRLYRDEALWNRLSAAGLRFVQAQFSAVAARDHLQVALTMGGAAGWERRAPKLDPAPARAAPGHAIVPSRFISELHRAAGITFDSTLVAPHGVEFRHAHQARRSHRGRLIDPGAVKLLFAGRVVEFKGVHLALAALPRIVRALPHLRVELSIVGDVQDAPYLRRLESQVAALGIEQHVRWSPPAREEDLFALFQEHDIYLFPSLFEPFALTLLLALEAGIPTVASAAGGNVDIVVDHRTGLLFESGNADRLADAVLELLADGELRRSVSDAGRAAAETYTMRAMVDRVEALLTRLASPAEPRA